MRELPALARRGLAFGLLAVTLSSCWNLLLRPLFLAANMAVEELDDARFELHRFTVLSRDAAAVTPETVHAEFNALQAELFAVEPATDVDARLIAAMDQLIRSSGIRLLQLKPGGTERTGALARHTVDINASGREHDLARLLAAIEAHRPRLVIDRASFLTQGGLPDSSALDVVPELAIELRVAGFAADIDAGDKPRSQDAP